MLEGAESVGVRGPATTNNAKRGPLAEQKLECERYIATNPNWILAADYAEHGTGLTGSRPQLQAMLAAIEASNITILVVRDLTRLTRNPRDAMRILERLDAAGVALHLVRDNFDSSSTDDRVLLQALGLALELEGKDLGDPIRTGFRAKREQDGSTFAAVPR